MPLVDVCTDVDVDEDLFRYAIHRPGNEPNTQLFPVVKKSAGHKTTNKP